MNRIILLFLAALAVTACGQQPAPQTTPAVSEAAPEPVAAPASPCDHVGALFDMLAVKKAEGWTEADALADMSARGESSLGYVVDGVFGNKFGEPGGMLARVEVLKVCRRLADGGDIY